MFSAPHPLVCLHAWSIYLLQLDLSIAFANCTIYLWRMNNVLVRKLKGKSQLRNQVKKRGLSPKWLGCAPTRHPKKLTSGSCSQLTACVCTQQCPIILKSHNIISQINYYTTSSIQIAKGKKEEDTIIIHSKALQQFKKGTGYQSILLAVEPLWQSYKAVNYLSTAHTITCNSPIQIMGVGLARCIHASRGYQN